MLYTIIIYDDQDRTLRARKPEHQTKRNTLIEHQTQHNRPLHQTPNTPEHNAKHFQKQNTKQNNTQTRVSAQQTLFIASPGQDHNQNQPPAHETK